MHAPHSKMTRKEISASNKVFGPLAHTYPEILTFFLTRNPHNPPVKCIMDDEARGHGGTIPDNLLTVVAHSETTNSICRKLVALHVCPTHSC